MTELLLQPGQLITASLLSLLIPKLKGDIPAYRSSTPKLSVSCSLLPHTANTTVFSMIEISILSWNIFSSSPSLFGINRSDTAIQKDN